MSYFRNAVVLCLPFGCCPTDRERIIVPITSGETKAVKLEVITDDVIRVMASPTGIFEESANLIKDTRQLPVPTFEITRSGDTITLGTATLQARLLQRTGEVWFTDKAGT